MVRRFEQQSEKGVRFWEVEVLGAELTMRTGRVGDRAFPQERNESCRSPSEAKREAEILIRSRLEAGFVERVEAPVVEEHEAALARGDEAEWLVFADRLLDCGDARGELIMLEHQRGRGRAAKKELDAWIDQHQDLLVGRLADHAEQLELEWRHGYLDGAKLFCEPVRSGAETEGESVANLLPALLAHESSRFLKTLRIGWPDPDEDTTYEAVVDSLTREPWPKYLRTLVLGDFTDSHALSFRANYEDEAWLHAENEVDLWPSLHTLGPLVSSGKLDALEVLHVRANVRRLGALTLPNLRHLEVAGQHMEPEFVRLLWASQLPALEGFVLEAPLSPGLRYDALQPLLEGRVFPGLKHFGLRGWGRDALSFLRLSPRLREARVIDLSANLLTDDDAAAVLQMKGAFAHLDKLLLRRNCFSKQAVRDLKEALPKADFAHQRTRRRSAGEREADRRAAQRDG